METKIFTDPAVEPNNENLEAALGKNYTVFAEFEKKTAALDLVLEWHYYNDAKSWLCKVLSKKKNLCWLSAWSTGFKLTFYFPDKAINGVYELDISDEIKTAAKEMKPVGKSHPVMFLVKSKKIINDGLKLLEYKRKLK